jgi:hypothetical protein
MSAKDVVQKAEKAVPYTSAVLRKKASDSVQNVMTFPVKH